MGEGVEEKALSLFCFHLSPFPPETPDTPANLNRIPALTVTDCHIGFKCTAVSSVFYLFIDDKKNNINIQHPIKKISSKTNYSLYVLKK